MPKESLMTKDGIPEKATLHVISGISDDLAALLLTYILEKSFKL